MIYIYKDIDRHTHTCVCVYISFFVGPYVQGQHTSFHIHIFQIQLKSLICQNLKSSWNIINFSLLNPIYLNLIPTSGFRTSTTLAPTRIFCLHILKESLVQILIWRLIHLFISSNKTMQKKLVANIFHEQTNNYIRVNNYTYISS